MVGCCPMQSDAAGREKGRCRPRVSPMMNQLCPALKPKNTCKNIKINIDGFSESLSSM